jgi:hypothetical protein
MSVLSVVMVSKVTNKLIHGFSEQWVETVEEIESTSCVEWELHHKCEIDEQCLIFIKDELSSHYIYHD